MNAAVKSEDSPSYQVRADEDEIIARAIEILKNRLRPGAQMSSPSVVKDYLALTETGDAVEQFRVLWLDSQHQVIALETLATGTINQAAVYPREVVRSALRHNASACIITHNHPSGSPEPSNSDRALTRHLKQALDLIDVRLLDHIVTASGHTMSFAEAGLI